jgi:membrane protein DedA with SNARE-associated domain
MARAEGWFERFGSWAVLLGRLTPLVRSFISIPAGVLGSRLGPYTVLTAIAAAIWCLGFAGIGWAAGSQWESVHSTLHYLDYVVVIGVIAVVGVVAVRWRRSRSALA